MLRWIVLGREREREREREKDRQRSYSAWERKTKIDKQRVSG